MSNFAIKQEIFQEYIVTEARPFPYPPKGKSLIYTSSLLTRFGGVCYGGIIMVAI